MSIYDQIANPQVAQPVSAFMAGYQGAQQNALGRLQLQRAQQQQQAEVSQQRMMDVLQADAQAGNDPQAWAAAVQGLVRQGKEDPQAAQQLLTNRAGVVAGIKMRLYGPSEGVKPVLVSKDTIGAYTPGVGFQRFPDVPTEPVKPTDDLAKLNQDFNNKLISPEDYRARRAQLLAGPQRAPVLVQDPNDPSKTVYVTPTEATGRRGAEDVKAVQSEAALATQAEQTAQSIDDSINNVQKTIDEQILPNLNAKSAGRWVAVSGALNEHDNGTLAKSARASQDFLNVKAGLTNVASAAFFNAISQLKAESGKLGNTGVGRIMQAEISRFESKIASLSQEQDPETLKKNLGRFTEQLGELRDRLRSQVATYRSSAAPTAPSAPIQNRRIQYDASGQPVQ